MISLPDGQDDGPRVVDTDLQRLLETRLHDPFGFLGRHSNGDGDVIRVYLPEAQQVLLVGNDGVLPMTQSLKTGLFQWRGPTELVPKHYRVQWLNNAGEISEFIDPYSFSIELLESDFQAWGNGDAFQAYHLLGAHLVAVDGVCGARFSVWAPNAERVSVVGDFNAWDGRRHPMRIIGQSGVWELFIPEISDGTLYKFELRNRDDGSVYLHSDPFGRCYELRPATSTKVQAPSSYDWQDSNWTEKRGVDWLHQPMSVYEVHLGSWRRHDDGRFFSYRELADTLVTYVESMGFTHVEFMPITEHPFDGSWGYQTTGFFAPTSRFGTPDDFRYLIDEFHRHDIGVLLDWVPAHFPKDGYALARFDGTPLYEPSCSLLAEHPDWKTLTFNYERNEVRSFLLSSAMFWLQEFHIDGLRVDAVASMLYLDYGRKKGQWSPNDHGGRENLEAVQFIHQLNQIVHAECPGAVVIAEESTAWPAVSRPVDAGGLGFSMKWNLGWMHDTLHYLKEDSIHRKFHHDNLTFSLLYAFTENFVLPLSHDEVVHGKGSLLNKMSGDTWQKFANLRLLFAYQFVSPGKKLLFMGNELAQQAEWDHDSELDWHLLERDEHAGIREMIRTLNGLYRSEVSLHRHDFDTRGFRWLDCHDADQSVLALLRQADKDFVVAVLNFTPVPRENYVVGVPVPGFYTELFNSDSAYFGGTDIGNNGGVSHRDQAHFKEPYSISITLPPLAIVIFRGPQ